MVTTIPTVTTHPDYAVICLEDGCYELSTKRRRRTKLNCKDPEALIRRMAAHGWPCIARSPKVMLFTRERPA